MPGLRVLHVASEQHPYVKTGGLGDVVGSLPAAQRRAGVDARVLLPGYPSVMAAVSRASVACEWPDLAGGGPARLLEVQLAGSAAPGFVVDAPGLYARGGGPYVDDRGLEWPDNARRFAALGSAARALVVREGAGFRPDLVHSHDWQGGMAVAYLKVLGPRELPCVSTVHSIEYPGSFDRAEVSRVGLPESSFDIHGVEFYGRFSFLKAALYYADRITTVSPSYAAQLQRDGEGGGFEGLLRARSGVLTGILNGIAYEEWDPGTDRHLSDPFGPTTLGGKAACKLAVQRALGLRLEPRSPLFGVVSRLVWQKGIDVLVAVAPWLVARGAQLLVLGTGESGLTARLGALAAAHPGSVAFVGGYDEGLAHRIQAGSDSILVPSRTEPCGLTQLYALRYGSPPVVRRTGGLADTVVDATPEALAAGTATGFAFEAATPEALAGALGRALAHYAQPELWQGLQRTAMRMDFGWQRSAERYIEVYRGLVR